MRPASDLADTNIANLRNLVAYFSQDAWRNNPHCQEGAEAATKALECLEAGNAQEALYNTLQATSAVSHLGVDIVKAMDETALVKALQPHAFREMKRQAGKQDDLRKAADDFRRRLTGAIERLETLVSGNSQMSWTAKVKKAAGDLPEDVPNNVPKGDRISERAFRKHMPAYLKPARKTRHR
jgi:hypothetical protein